LEFNIQPGLTTAFNPHISKNAGVLTANNFEIFDLLQGVSNSAGSTLKCGFLPGGVSSLNYFEYFNLAGTLTREQIALAGTVLYKINTTTLVGTPLMSGVVQSGEAVDSAVINNRLHLASPNNDGKKYDGFWVTKWGLFAPGGQFTTLDSTSSLTNHSITPDGLNTFELSSTAILGSSSIQVDKLDPTVSGVNLNDSGFSYNVTTAGTILYVNLFLPAGSLQSLPTSGTAVINILSTSGTAIKSTWTTSIGGLIEGWNIIPMDLNNPTSTTSGGVNTKEITNYSFGIVTRNNAATLSGVLWNYWYKTDNGLLVATSGTDKTGALTTPATYRVTFLSQYGFQSNAGAPSLSVSPDTISGSNANLTNIPISSDPQVIARNLYRDSGGDAIWRFVATVPDNTTTTFTDTVPDASRGLSTPPIAGDTSFDNSPPPRFRSIAYWLGHVFGISSRNPYQVYISNLNNPSAGGTPEGFPLNNIRVFTEELTKLVPGNNGLFVHAKQSTYFMTGDSINNFVFNKIDPLVGMMGRRAAVSIAGSSTGVGFKGIGLFNPNETWEISQAIRDLYATFDTTQLTNSFVINDEARFRALFFVAGQILVYQYGTMGAGQITPIGALNPFDLRMGSWWKLVLPSGVTPLCAEVMETTPDLKEAWIGTQEGYTYRLQDPATDNYAVASGVVPVSGTLETKWAAFTDGARYSKCRYLIIDVQSTVTTNWAVNVSTATDAGATVISGGNYNFVVPPNGSLETPLPAGLIGTHVKVTLTNNTLNQRATIRSLRMKHIPRTYRGPRTG